MTLYSTKIIKEIRTGEQNYVIEYYYDSSDKIVGFNYNNNDYFYIKDLQGNVSKIIDINDNIMVEYYYSSYGYSIKTIDNSNLSLSTINPYRYRSYYQDNETGWYYLNSRYYDSNTCRFISMDDISYLGASSTINSYNLFTYCEGNPVMFVDYDGNLSKCIFKVRCLLSAGTARVIFYKKKKYEILEWNDNDYKYNQNDEKDEKVKVNPSGSVSDGMINKNIMGKNNTPLDIDGSAPGVKSMPTVHVYQTEGGGYDYCFEYFAMDLLSGNK